MITLSTLQEKMAILWNKEPWCLVLCVWEKFAVIMEFVFLMMMTEDLRVNAMTNIPESFVKEKVLHSLCHTKTLFLTTQFLCQYFIISLPERIVYFKEKGSMMVLTVQNEYVDFDLSFSIRPQVKTAPLFVTFKKKDFIAISMRDGSVEARYIAKSFHIIT